MRVAASKVVRALDTLKGRNSTIFNDATTFGRSIKVWGWSQLDYADAKSYLEDAGYKVKVVLTPRVGSGFRAYGGSLRLHVFE